MSVRWNRMKKLTGNTRFFSVHIHYTANDHSLSVLFIMIRKFRVLSMLFIALHFFIQSLSCCRPQISAACLVWFSHFHVILYIRCLHFSVQWNFGQGVSSWVPFPRWFAAIRALDAPLSISVFLDFFFNKWHSPSSSRRGFQRAIYWFLPA